MFESLQIDHNSGPGLWLDPYSEEEADNFDEGDERPIWRQLKRGLRHLAGSSDSRMDYSVLSVGVMTLGLIMVVEVLRHRLDHAAVGRPYFTAVLENIYAELTTLGIVEFFVFLLQTYYTNMDKDKKEVFSDVHFALFYTAILNAFQSIILAFITSRVSNRIWVQTEAIELNHYVEVREEFERVQALLNKNRKTEDKRGGSGSSTSSDPGREENDDYDNQQQRQEEGGIKKDDSGGSAKGYHTEYVFEASWRGLQALWTGVVDAVRRPRLNRQYNNLLLQVRFHELRVHFVQSYDLPPKLKVSDYLIRCEQAVLIKLVHVSSVAWLLLTASTNLLYYVLGVVGYFEESSSLVGVSLTYIFFCAMGIFILLALLVFDKMKSIFREIMHREELWEVTPDKEKQQRHAKQQMNLFWGGSPKIVIAAIQFMQFGYAVALSVVIIFWDTIKEGDVQMEWFLLAIAICYSSFVAVAAHVIPRYTLCTSLAQLVDKKRLNETVANYHLGEAKRRHEAEAYMRAYAHEHETPSIAPYHETGRAAPSKPPSKASSLSSDTRASLDESVELTIADLVRMNTSSLRNVVPKEDTSDTSGNLSQRQVRRERRRRQRAISDGVAIMASMKEGREEEEKVEVEDWQTPSSFDRTVSDGWRGQSLVSGTQSAPPPRRRARGDRRRSASDGVAAMAAMRDPGNRTPTRSEDGDSERIADLVKVDTAALRDQLPSEELQKLEEKEKMRRSRPRMKSNSDPNKMAQMTQGSKDSEDDGDPLERRRRRRQKTVSDGVQFMASLKASTLGFLKPIKSETSVAASEALSGSDDKNNDDASIMSHASSEDGDDNLSDAGDIPKVDQTHLNEFRRIELEREKTPTFKERCNHYFVSKKFPVTSNVFGTMVAFFLLGSRVERFMHTENIVPTYFISFDFNQTVTFAILSAWFFFFIVTDLLVLYSVDKSSLGRKYRVAHLASAMDIIIVGVCWIVFWVAEIKRCCHPDSANHRWMAASGTLGPHECDCTTFGSRLYGGLGTIEPWASLIALRLFRFYVAKKFVVRQDRKRGVKPTAADEKDDLDDEQNLDPFNVHHSAKAGGAHGEIGTSGGHGHEQPLSRGTAPELWEMAIGQYPEIAEKYGLFSAEILQVMLGLPLRSTDTASTVAETETDQDESSFAAAGQQRDEPRQRRSSYVLDKRFSALSVDAQEIIMQGKLGRKVTAVTNIDKGGTIPEDDVPRRATSYAFQIDETSIAPPVHLDYQLPFDAPNARLVRSMRRCDRKLVPILNKWTVVDVVLTRFEMVYFDATDSLDGPEVNATFQALKGTKGGKGLRLKDVAVGRKVVGHLLLSDITSLAIERYLPTDEWAEINDWPDEIVPENEFWKADTMHFSRKEAWHRTRQDTLAVHTKHHHTLYLRFYSDLEDAEMHPERLDEENRDVLCKNNAFQWVQTLGRFCGPEHLHQNLPHFGEENDDELRDYLIVHQQGEQKKNLMFLASHAGNMRRNETVADTLKRTSRRFTALMPRNLRSGGSNPIAAIAEEPESADLASSTPAGASAKTLRRVQSLGDATSAEKEVNGSSFNGLTESPLPSRPNIRRSASMGDQSTSSSDIVPTRTAESNKQTHNNDSPV